MTKRGQLHCCARSAIWYANPAFSPAFNGVQELESTEKKRKPIPIVLTDELIKRFWSNVDKRSQDECWEWRAALRNGYGAIKSKGILYSSHRLAYTIANGDPPDDLVIGHKCDNRMCCNPAHLEAITYSKNNTDAFARSRKTPTKGEAIHTAKLTEEQVRSICKYRIATGDGARKIARKFGFSVHSVKAILERHAWRHIAVEYGL